MPATTSVHFATSLYCMLRTTTRTVTAHQYILTAFVTVRSELKADDVSASKDWHSAERGRYTLAKTWRTVQNTSKPWNHQQSNSTCKQNKILGRKSIAKSVADMSNGGYEALQCHLRSIFTTNPLRNHQKCSPKWSMQAIARQTFCAKNLGKWVMITTGQHMTYIDIRYCMFLWPARPQWQTIIWSLHNGGKAHIIKTCGAVPA